MTGYMTPELLRSIAGSHRATFEAKVVTSFQVGDNPTGTVIPILGGDVQLDGTAEIRGTLDLTTDGNGVWPRGGNDLLAPYGNEVFVRRGVDLGASIAWVPLGYYRINAPEQDDPPDGPIKLTGADRMASIIDSRLTEPRQYTASTTVGQVFRDLVGEIYPDYAIFFEANIDSFALGRVIIAEESRHEPLADIAASRGMILYFDGAGVLQVRTPPDPGSPLWEVKAGAGGVLVSASRRLTREGVVNGLVVTGEAADTEAPARAIAVNANPASPTFWGGRFGRVPQFYSSPLITTDAQAQTAANSILARSLGFPYSVDFTAVPNPALQPWDPVRVTQSNGDAETHVIQAVTIPLSADAALTATTKEKTVIAIGGA